VRTGPNTTSAPVPLSDSLVLNVVLWDSRHMWVGKEQESRCTWECVRLQKKILRGSWSAAVPSAAGLSASSSLSLLPPPFPLSLLLRQPEDELLLLPPHPHCPNHPTERRSLLPRALLQEAPGHAAPLAPTERPEHGVLGTQSGSVLSSLLARLEPPLSSDADLPHLLPRLLLPVRPDPAGLDPTARPPWPPVRSATSARLRHPACCPGACYHLLPACTTSSLLARCHSQGLPGAPCQS